MDKRVQKYLKPQVAGKPKVFAVSSVSEFVEVAIWLYPDERVIFRGQTTEKDWPLVPSVGRDMERSQVLLREKEILEEFERESIPYIDIVPDNDWQWLALAQHNRLPTRLLDWSKNPLVALWFAVKDTAIDNQPGVVWAFHYEESESVFSTKDLESPLNKMDREPGGTVTNGGALRDLRQQHPRIDKGERMKQKAQTLIAKQRKDCVYRHFV
ncbi:MAG: FRG domain-containing protein, partial [Phycisphaerae bacterium]|nr:FRG domain-containing protein [Phycisphaerae bacterium]